MTSADIFDPRLLIEFRRYTTEVNPHDQQMKKLHGMPEDYDSTGFIKVGSENSQMQQNLSPDVSANLGTVSWTGEDYLRKLDLSDLRHQIRHYEKISPKLVDRPSIRRELFKALKAPGSSSIVLPFDSKQIQRGTPLLRARKINSPSDIQVRSDVWTAPPKFIGAGRLNDVGEPLLYTALDPFTAVHEIHTEPGDMIALSFFTASKRILAVNMSGGAPMEGLSKGSRRKLDLIMKFLVSAFSQKVPSNDPSRYITPDLIAKEYFNYQPDIFSGWLYKSVADPRDSKGFNLALRGETAHGLVDYQKTQIIEVEAVHESGEGATVVAELRQVPGSERLERVPF